MWRYHERHRSYQCCLLRKRVHSFNIVYILLEIDIYEFITNKLCLSMNREPLLHVSAIIYSHLEGSNSSGNM